MNKYDWSYECEKEQEQLYCKECKEPCEAVELSWEYAGTHCTFGRSGIHRTGQYYSNCCDGDLVTSEDIAEEAEHLEDMKNDR